MGFDPFSEKGMPIDKQIKAWKEVNVKPVDPLSVHPYTRTRIILMNGIEVEAAIFGHNYARHTDNTELKRKLAMTRRSEQQQQKMINWLLPAQQSPLEVTLGYEQVAVDLTAGLARTEPDPYVKAALEFALIEDFDHLYRYANLYETMEGKDAAKIIGDLTEVFPGRPTINEHRHPFDSITKHYDRGETDPLTKLHVATIIAAEQQTMNYYMNIGPVIADHTGRGLYQEIAMIEEQHVTHYESLADPNASWLEMLVLHEYNECYLYHSFVQSETDDRVKQMWQRHLEQEIEHLHLARELMKSIEKKDPAEMFPKEMPEAFSFRPNKEYVRQVVAEQIDLTKDEGKFVPLEKMKNRRRYDEFQKQTNGDKVPSQEVIERNIAKNGRDYRVESEGEHPVAEFRNRKEATRRAA